MLLHVSEVVVQCHHQRPVLVGWASASVFGLTMLMMVVVVVVVVVMVGGGDGGRIDFCAICVRFRVVGVGGVCAHRQHVPLSSPIASSRCSLPFSLDSFSS